MSNNNKCLELQKVKILQKQLEDAEQALYSFQQKCIHNYSEVSRSPVFDSELARTNRLKLSIKYECSKCGDVKFEYNECALVTIDEYKRYGE